MYERDYTWIESDREQSVKYVLEGLVKAGFNGVRLPMWPESDEVNGPNPYNPAINVDHSYCSELTTKIVDVIKNSKKSDPWDDFYIYLSPGYDNMLFQEDLSAEDYAAWVQKHFVLEPTFLSAFSANASPLELGEIDEKSRLQDRVTLFELDVNHQLRKQSNVPILIGPDRATVEHSVNVMESFDGSLRQVRPDYRLAIDMIGTQARYGD